MGVPVGRWEVIRCYGCLIALSADPCPPEAAACLVGGPRPVNLGRVKDSPQWKDGVTILQYVDGDLCPDGIRKKSTTIRFTCNENQMVSDGPVVYV